MCMQVKGSIQLFSVLQMYKPKLCKFDQDTEVYEVQDPEFWILGVVHIYLSQNTYTKCKEIQEIQVS